MVRRCRIDENRARTDALRALSLSINSIFYSSYVVPSFGVLIPCELPCVQKFPLPCCAARYLPHRRPRASARRPRRRRWILGLGVCRLFNHHFISQRRRARTRARKPRSRPRVRARVARLGFRALDVNFTRRRPVFAPQEPSTLKKYIVKVDAVVELLVRAASSACDSLTYATDIAIPTVSDYEDFTMPTKPDITTLKVKSTDKM